ncbi:phosphotransferase [Marinicella rhabdoformis]|uniref:phosphotransferase n=1 Tax=Marinicella rhabdoformis TaxID=2580566 RepID=UPI0012AEBBDD|nr:phosphotransferase [Marinicella rhabdoformis]
MSNNRNDDKTTVVKDSVINDWGLNQWEEKVAELPEVRKAGYQSLTELIGGTINKTFKVKTQRGVYVVRFNNDELPGIHRQTEAQILEAIRPLNIAPKLIVNNFSKGYLITEYFEGEPWQSEDLKNPEKLMQLADKIAPLHQIQFQNKRSELVFRMVEYIHYFSEMDTSLKSSINAIVTELIHLGFWKKQSNLLHFDLNPMNIIDNGQDICILDWEFAGAGHPLIEWCVVQNYAGVDVSEFLPQFPHISYHKKVQELIKLMMEMWQV